MDLKEQLNKIIDSAKETECNKNRTEHDLNFIREHSISDDASLEEQRSVERSSLAEQRAQSFHEQTLKFREYVKSRAYIILYCELIFLGFIVLLQGFNYYTHFHLNDWVINIFSGSCILQTFLIIRSIVISVFPNNSKK